MIKLLHGFMLMNDMVLGTISYEYLVLPFQLFHLAAGWIVLVPNDRAGGARNEFREAALPTGLSGAA